ncbi:2OG-Fe(II) oxygenase [Simiduia aestuariiviva]|uniref:SM-20-related protein n=1 Tax=Simiduia aestuariiviva TaxID=1510459 RepID=A0A839UP92_9GAMM|nr:2OG-Fe(II) oxygenase [Simiduia aestuariiviva]MBB3167257.1 SM-20-related protein [Simiduia aestuariiviva]
MSTALNTTGPGGRDSDYINLLSEHGWALLPGFLSAELVAGLRWEAMQSADWQQAGVGLEGQRQTKIRRDHTIWMKGDSEPQREYFQQMEAIRLRVNEIFFAGLFEYESHFAHYPEGAFYRKHRDALRGRGARILTSVCYLNPQWQPGDGGELLLYNDADTTQLAQIAPKGGDLLLFWSEDFPHEVLPAKVDRYSIAGWFRRNLELANPL